RLRGNVHDQVTQRCISLDFGFLFDRGSVAQLSQPPIDIGLIDPVAVDERQQMAAAEKFAEFLVKNDRTNRKLRAAKSRGDRNSDRNPKSEIALHLKAKFER